MREGKGIRRLLPLHKNPQFCVKYIFLQLSKFECCPDAPRLPMNFHPRDLFALFSPLRGESPGPHRGAPGVINPGTPDPHKGAPGATDPGTQNQGRAPLHGESASGLEIGNSLWWNPAPGDSITTWFIRCKNLMAAIFLLATGGSISTLILTWFVCCCELSPVRLFDAHIFGFDVR